MSIFPSYLNLWFLIYVLNSRSRQTYLLARLSGYSPPRICILFSGRRRISQEGPVMGGRECRNLAVLVPRQALLSMFVSPQPMLGTPPCPPKITRMRKS